MVIKDMPIQVGQWLVCLMKIALITTHIWPAKGYGGVSAAASRLVRAWLKAGIEPIICTSDASEGPSLRRFDIKANYPRATLTLYRAMWFKRWGFGLAAITRVWKACYVADVIYINGIGTWPCTLGAVYSVILKKPFIIAVHGGMMPSHVEQIKRRKPHKWLYYTALTFPTLRRANFVHVCSKREAEAVHEVLPSVAVVTIMNGIPLPSDKAKPPGSNKLHICYVGRISQEKGINTFLREWLKIRGNGERFSIAGEGVGPYFEEFMELCAQAEQAIQYVGEVPTARVYDLIAESHFLVLPSGLDGGGERENFGIVVAESLALGRPVMLAHGLAWDHLEGLGASIVLERAAGSVSKGVYAARAMLGTKRYDDACQAAREYAEEFLNIEGTAGELYRLCVNTAKSSRRVGTGRNA